MEIKGVKIDWEWVKDCALKKEVSPIAKKSDSGKIILRHINEGLKEARSLARPKISLSVKNISGTGGGKIRIGRHISFSGKKLSSYIKGSRQICLFLATIGSGLEKAASGYMEKGEYARGYILDRIGSFAVESLAESLEHKLRRKAASSGLSISTRLSPGYCDWPVEEQRKLAKLVDFKRAGIKLTQSCMMAPKKSISAILGIGPKGLFSSGRTQCAICKDKNCDYRRAS